jgi:hypothetical protein
MDVSTAVQLSALVLWDMALFCWESQSQCSFQTPGTTLPNNQRHISEGWNPQGYLTLSKLCKKQMVVILI